MTNDIEIPREAIPPETRKNIEQWANEQLQPTRYRHRASGQVGMLVTSRPALCDGRFELAYTIRFESGKEETYNTREFYRQWERME